jgi:membrane protease YdiL (CAAX protease family)
VSDVTPTGETGWFPRRFRDLRSLHRRLFPRRGLAASAGDLPAVELPAPWVPGRVATAIAACAYLVVLFSIFVLASFTLMSGLGGRIKLVVTLAEVAGILVPALVALWALDRAGFRFARRVPLAGEAIVPIVGLTVFGFVVTYSASVLWVAGLDATGWEWVAEAQRRVRETFGPLLATRGAADAVTLVLTVSLVPAVCEELAFRGVLQRLLRTRFPAGVSIGVTAFLFSAFHADPLGFPARLFLGISLGLAFERTRSLLAPALIHGAHNMASVILVLAAGGLADPTIEADPAVLRPLLPFLAIVVVLGVGAWLFAARLLPPAPAPSPSPEPAPEPAPAPAPAPAPEPAPAPAPADVRPDVRPEGSP